MKSHTQANQMLAEIEHNTVNFGGLSGKLESLTIVPNNLEAKTFAATFQGWRINLQKKELANIFPVPTSR